MLTGRCCWPTGGSRPTSPTRPPTRSSTSSSDWEADMLRTTLAGLRARRWRMIATALAIVLGVGFVAGALVFGDTAKAALYDQYARAAQNIDLSVQPPPAAGGWKSAVD